MAGLSEETAVKLVQQIGELTGTVRQHMDQQADVNLALFNGLKEQKQNIEDVKTDIHGYKKLVRGVIIGVGLGGTSLGAAIMKAAGVAHSVGSAP